MKKLVLKVDLDDCKKQKAMATVSGISGVTSVGVDMKEKKMTVIGEIDAVEVTCRLRKVCQTYILTLGEDKKEDGGGKGKDGDTKPPDVAELERLYRLYYSRIHYPVMCVEENPNPCTIC